MREVAGEEIEATVVVEVAEARADRVAAVEPGARRGRAARRSLVGEARLAVVDEQRVRLEAVVRPVDVEIAVLVEVAGGHAARAAVRGGGCDAETLAALVEQHDRRIGRLRRPVLVAAEARVDEAVVVEVGDGDAARDGRRQFGQLHRLEADAVALAHAARDGDRRERHEVADAVVVDVGDHAFAGRIDAREGLALAVQPQDAAGPEIAPAIGVGVAPRGVPAGGGDSHFGGTVDEARRRRVRGGLKRGEDGDRGHHGFRVIMVSG